LGKSCEVWWSPAARGASAGGSKSGDPNRQDFIFIARETGRASAARGPSIRILHLKAPFGTECPAQPGIATVRWGAFSIPAQSKPHPGGRTGRACDWREQRVRAGFADSCAAIDDSGIAKRLSVFTGRSGAGKSTVASLAPAGTALTDEISLLRRHYGAWQAYGTPFWGEFRAEGQNRSAPIGGIYSLVQAGKNRLELCTGREALAVLLGNTLFFSRAARERQRLLDTIIQLTREVPVYRLEFRKDTTFWELLP
jgi:hypothetical protein